MHWILGNSRKGAVSIHQLNHGIGNGNRKFQRGSDFRNRHIPKNKIVAIHKVHHGKDFLNQPFFRENRS